MFVSVSLSFLNTGVILAILSFDGYVLNLIHVLSISVRTIVLGEVRPKVKIIVGRRKEERGRERERERELNARALL